MLVRVLDALSPEAVAPPDAESDGELVPFTDRVLECDGDCVGVSTDRVRLPVVDTESVVLFVFVLSVRDVVSVKVEVGERLAEWLKEIVRVLDAVSPVAVAPVDAEGHCKLVPVLVIISLVESEDERVGDALWDDVVEAVHVMLANRDTLREGGGTTDMVELLVALPRSISVCDVFLVKVKVAVILPDAECDGELVPVTDRVLECNVVSVKVEVDESVAESPKKLSRVLCALSPVAVALPDAKGECE